MGYQLYEVNFFYVCVKIEAYEANSPLQKRFRDFSQRGYVFGFYWDQSIKRQNGQNLNYPDPLSTILGDFFFNEFQTSSSIVVYNLVSKTKNHSYFETLLEKWIEHSDPKIAIIFKSKYLEKLSFYWFDTLQEELFVLCWIRFMQIFSSFCYAVFEIFDTQVLEFREIGVPYTPMMWWEVFVQLTEKSNLLLLWTHLNPWVEFTVSTHHWSIVQLSSIPQPVLLQSSSKIWQ